MTNIPISLVLHQEIYAICRLPKVGDIPSWLNVSDTHFVSITYTEDELSIVCEQVIVPDIVTANKDWRLFRVAGTLDFSLTGILSCIIAPLKTAKISVFVISTYDTDYILVKNTQRQAAINLWQNQFHLLMDRETATCVRIVNS